MNNDPPKVIFTTKPSLLVLVDGPPRFRDVGGTDLQLMLNTRAMILLDTKKKLYYLNVMDGWLQAPDLVGGPMVLHFEDSRRYEGNHQGHPGTAAGKSSGRHSAAIAERSEKGWKDSGDLCECGPMLSCW